MANIFKTEMSISNVSKELNEYRAINGKEPKYIIMSEDTAIRARDGTNPWVPEKYSSLILAEVLGTRVAINNLVKFGEFEVVG